MRILLSNGVAWPQPVFAPPDEGAGAGAGAGDGAPDTGSNGGENNNGGGNNNGGENPDGGGGESPDGGGDGAPDTGTTPLPSSDWRDRELRSKHAQIQQSKQRMQELDNENASLREMVEQLRRGNVPGGGDDANGGQPSPTASQPASPAAPSSSDMTREQITAAAQQMVEQREFDNAANKVYTDGTARYKDQFQKAIDQLEILGGIDRETLSVILGSDDPAKVLFELGSKPDEYRRVMDLPPAKRVAELVKIGIPAAPAPKRPSGATPPTDPIRGQQRADTTTLSDDLSDDEWNRRRLDQRAARHRERQAGAR